MSSIFKTLGSVISGVAPTIAGVLGGKGAESAVAWLSEKVFGRPDGTADEVVQTLQGWSPDQLLRLREWDQEYRMAQLSAETDLEKSRLATESDLEKSYVADTSDARHVHAENAGIFYLGLAILVTFTMIMGAVLWGSYAVMTGGMPVRDVALVAMATGLIGTVVGYAAANAQQVVSYYFGSSRGSSTKTDAMSRAVAAMGQSKR
jgi:hypothetical protein